MNLLRYIYPIIHVTIWHVQRGLSQIQTRCNFVAVAVEKLLVEHHDLFCNFVSGFGQCKPGSN